VAIDPIYNYKKAYNKYYKDNKDNKEDFYRDRNDNKVARGSSQSNYPL